MGLEYKALDLKLEPTVAWKGLGSLPQTEHYNPYAVNNPIRYTDPAGLSATETNQAAYTADCGINCGLIGKAIANAVASAFHAIANLLENGSHADRSVGRVARGIHVLKSGSSIINNPHTVKAEWGAIKTPEFALRQASAFLENGDTVDEVVGIACIHASSYAGGPCASSLTARAIVIIAAHEQHISLCSTPMV